MEMIGIEPMTVCMQSIHSTKTELHPPVSRRLIKPCTNNIIVINVEISSLGEIGRHVRLKI